MLYFSNDGSRRLNSETATIPTNTNNCVGTMLKRRMVSPSGLQFILLTILILPTPGHAIYLSQLSGFLYKGNSLAAIRGKEISSLLTISNAILFAFLCRDELKSSHAYLQNFESAQDVSFLKSRSACTYAHLKSNLDRQARDIFK